ncbi:hypothetical protein CERSUDRAFT_93517 [Gelatoporia subvermispora B]|uniref:Vacuolar membrane-associated protein Iml1 N-terminal domain-containing protein n=1 Tax=Ceriporiopsis subvermispora (strain B) TaxID=914234 RepID=M2RHM9_CERS8|nr:hypothetical protein CERSUDRAFT_93517 [Gelatoporia subvermispora B]
MSLSRPESQASQAGGRRRSNTVRSLHAPPPVLAPPLRIGDSKTLTTWVHDPRESPHVTLNPHHWPGVVEGDMIRVCPGSADTADEADGFLFIVVRDEGVLRHQLQVSVPHPVADKFGIRNNGEVTLTKIDKSKCCADYIELTFQDQYLGRNEMWRLERHLVGQCVWLEQEISFIGVIGARVQAIFIDGKEVPAAYVTSATKLVYRSLSAKATIFIQVCRELWEFASDGERYNEKIVHSFLPALFGKWREAGTTHIVTIVLISRVFYDSSEIEYAAGPLRRDDEGRSYKDFFKVITDLEVLYDWKPTLVALKDSFWAFQHDILLAHHHHRAGLSSSPQAQAQTDHVRLVGQLSYAHDGPVLEALNLGLNPGETHYVDRSLSLTGAATIVVTPGTGYFRVSKQLLRLTTTRLLDQGFALDIVSLAKAPLHQSPIFAFQGLEPQARADAGKLGSRALDPLWGCDEESSDSVIRRKATFWWEPFWMSISFWDKQMDLPFRKDRFVARAKMHEIEMLGLLDYDVLSNIKVPFLPEPLGSSILDSEPQIISQEEADKFDMDIFAAPEPKPALNARSSIVSTSGISALHASLRSNELRRSTSSRVSELFRVHPPIEEDPQPNHSEQMIDVQSSEAEKRLSAAMLDVLKECKLR